MEGNKKTWERRAKLMETKEKGSEISVLVQGPMIEGGGGISRTALEA